MKVGCFTMKPNPVFRERRSQLATTEINHVRHVCQVYDYVITGAVTAHLLVISHIYIKHCSHSNVKPQWLDSLRLAEQVLPFVEPPHIEPT